MDRQRGLGESLAVAARVRPHIREDTFAAHIWIAASQQIDEESREGLLKVAATVRPAATWSGSSLDDISKIPPQSRLRYALLTPRVAAPHLNQALAPLSGEEAIVSLMLCRLSELDQYEQQNLIPDAADRSTGSWEWRFFDALRTYLTTGRLESTKHLLEEPARPYQRTAVHAAYLAFLAEQGEYQTALDFFAHLQLDEIDDPIDRAWLSTHGAWYLLERGHQQESLEAALDASTIGAFATHDPTALTISAAAFTGAFSATDMAPEHFEPMMRANDVAPLWWRNQQRAWALSAQFNQECEEWADKGRGRYPEETTAWQQLRSIVLTSGVAGDHRAWKSATAQLARFELMMKSSQFRDDDYATALRDLRLAGDEKAVGLAVRKLGDDGPCHAVAIAGHHLDNLKSTRTSLASDIKLVTAGADFLSDSDAERHAAWALAVLAEPARIQPLTQSVPWTCRYVVEMLRSLWPRLGREATEAARSFLTEMPYLADQSVSAHFNDMSADVVATERARCCDPVVAVENVVLTVPCPDFDGWERLTLAHDDQDAAEAGAGSVTDGPEVPVEPVRCAVDGTDDAGDRDELFADLPKVRVVVSDVPQNRKA